MPQTKGLKLPAVSFPVRPEQQAIYVKTGRSKTMKSIHLKRCAIDLNFFLNGKIIWDKATIAPLGAYWESLNVKNRWGGNFSNLVDCPHFERNVG
jgi:hypothetical protein